MQTIWTKSTDGELSVEHLSSSMNSDMLNEVCIHNVVSVKQKTTTQRGEQPFKCRALEITDAEGNTFEIKLFMEQA